MKEDFSNNKDVGFDITIVFISLVFLLMSIVSFIIFFMLPPVQSLKLLEGDAKTFAILEYIYTFCNGITNLFFAMFLPFVMFQNYKDKKRTLQIVEQLNKQTEYLKKVELELEDLKKTECPNCKTKNNSNSEYCSSCGCKLSKKE